MKRLKSVLKKTTLKNESDKTRVFYRDVFKRFRRLHHQFLCLALCSTLLWSPLLNVAKPRNHYRVYRFIYHPWIFSPAVV